MRTALFALVLSAAGLITPLAASQENDARVKFEATKQKAEHGNAVAQYFLGRRYYYGEGVAKDDAQAVKWFRKAAEHNHAPAQYFLGVCYAKGEGIGMDHSEAAKLYRQAAMQDEYLAQSALGFCHETGRGVEKDVAEAYAWYDVSAKSPAHTFHLAAERRGELEKKMTPQQLERGKKRAKELRAQIEARFTI